MTVTNFTINLFNLRRIEIANNKEMLRKGPTVTNFTWL